MEGVISVRKYMLGKNIQEMLSQLFCFFLNVKMGHWNIKFNACYSSCSDNNLIHRKIDLTDNMFAHPVSLFSFSEVRPCQYEGVLKQPGESFHSNNCQKQCRCSLQGELLCQPTVCPSGLKLRGMQIF